MTDSFLRELAERAEQLDGLRAALAAHPGCQPSTWAAQTDFPFLAAFDRDEVAEFARELTAGLLDAERRGDFAELDGNLLRAWESTATILGGDPEALAELTAPVDPAQFVEVFPPAAADARSSEAAG